MRKLFGLLLLTSISFHTVRANHPVRHVKKVILWGHKLHSHTHSYIHWGYSRAFKHMGYETHWLDNQDNVTNFDFSNSLFITAGSVDQDIPIRDDCFYVIHNCDQAKYRHLISSGRAIILQVYTHDCLDRKEPALSRCFHYDLRQPVIYMPWATDLLPYEIETNKKKIANIRKNETATFVGTITPGIPFDNNKQIEPFKRACKEHDITFKQEGSCNRSMDDNIQCVQQALLAPSLQGWWQCEKGYIPCRIFKNISYGAMPITNSKAVYELLNKKIIYHPDSYQLGLEAIKRVKTWSLEDQYALMDVVKEKHTYLNRIESLFQFFEMVAQHQTNQG